MMTAPQFKDFCKDHGVEMGERMAYYIFAGQSHFGTDRAMILAQSTDVPLAAWLRPESVFNKYLQHLFKTQKAG